MADTTTLLEAIENGGPYAVWDLMDDDEKKAAAVAFWNGADRESRSALEVADQVDRERDLGVCLGLVTAGIHGDVVLVEPVAVPIVSTSVLAGRHVVLRRQWDCQCGKGDIVMLSSTNRPPTDRRPPEPRRTA